MNTETSILVAIVLAMILIAAAYGAVSATIDQTGDSLFGSENNDDGLFEPDSNGDYNFPDQNQQQSSSNLKILREVNV